MHGEENGVYNAATSPVQAEVSGGRWTERNDGQRNR